MKLHDWPRSSAAFRVRIALNLKGMSYQSVFCDLAQRGQRAPEYLDLNPQGLVPTLEEDGEVLTQSLAIVEYLNETGPGPLLLPGHPADRARVRGLAQIIACDIHPLGNSLRVKSYLAEKLGQDETGWSEWHRHWIAEGFDALEALLAGDDRTGRFCHGDEPGLADIFLVPQVVNAGRVDLDMTPYPTIQRIYAACMALPAFRKAHPGA
jgi:maleylacetoacetate isomerase